MYRKSIFSDDLDGNSSKNLEDSKSSNNAKFPWGGKMTPKRKATSPLLNSKVITKTNGSLALHKIDPQMYVDTRSRGLVSRIVKYHDNNQKTDKSSLRSVYNKPGQFPIVHLNKSEMLNSTPRQIQSISRVKIAPPDKLVCQVNSRSNILRSGGSLRCEPEKLHMDNEPLAPTTEVEIIPTKSVLDALKEISRKRINSDDVDAERNKKLCSEPKDKIDYPEQNRVSGIVTKRQRDTQISPNSQANLVNKQFSQKKKLCTKNNDILSSLSSSVRLQPNKKSDVKKPVQQEKFVNIRYVTKIKIQTDVTKVAQIRSDLNVTEEISNTSNNDSTLNITNISPDKETLVPKLTLFNRDYSKESELEGKKRLEKVHSDDNIENNISFIKPKEQTISSFGNEKEIMSGAYKNKLSLMLSCLRGDVDEEDDDVTDTTKTSKKNENTVLNKENELKSGIVANTQSSLTTTTLTSLLKPNAIAATTESNGSFKPITFGGTHLASSHSVLNNKEKDKTETTSMISQLPQYITKPVTTSSVTTATIQKTATFDFSKPVVLNINSTTNSVMTSSSPRVGGFSFPAKVTSPSTISTAVETTTITATYTSLPVSSIAAFGLTNSVISSIPSTNSNFTFGGPKLATNTTNDSAVVPVATITFGKEIVGESEASSSIFSFSSGTTVKPVISNALLPLTLIGSTETKQTTTSFNFGPNQQSNIFPFVGTVTRNNAETQLANNFAKETPKPTANNTTFNFLNTQQQTNQPIPINFGQKQTTEPTATKNVGFSSTNIDTEKTENFTSGFTGINQPSNNNSLTFNSVKTTTSPLNLSSFGNQNPSSTTTTTSSSVFSFGTTSGNEPTFSSVAKTQNPISTFGKTNPVSTSSFNFLTDPSLTASSTGVVPAFGINNQNSVQNSNDFNFGNSTQNTTIHSNIFSKPSQPTSSNNTLSSDTFNFGSGVQSNALPAFAADLNQSNNSVFDTKITQNKSTVFGGFSGTQQQQTNLNTQSSSSGIFSSPGQNQETSLNSNQPNSNNLFNFGNDNKISTTTTSTRFQSNNNSQFGNIQKQTHNDNLISFTPVTQPQNASVFGFGRSQSSTGTATGPTQASSSTSLFPFNNSNVTGNSFTNMASVTPTTTTESLFGSGGNANSFGGTTTNATNNNLPSFGSITNNNNNNQQSFGGKDNVKPFSFGAANNNQNPFGGGRSNNNFLSSAVMSPFSSSTGPTVATDKPAFNFKFGQTPANSSQSGMFSNDNSALNNNNNALPAYGINPNPFSIGGGASTPRRPMRTATRRLK